VKTLWNSALALLVANGALLGLTPPLGKLASAAGLPPMVWAFVISAGAGLVLLAVVLARGAQIRLDRATLTYLSVTAAISYAIPNILIFSVVPHLGAGYTGIMFTLSPVFTLALSIVLGVRRPSGLGLAGILIGFVGAVTVALTRGEAGAPAEMIWVLLGLAIPVSLAAGNIYRTARWPDEAGPLELAAGSHLAAAIQLLIGIVIAGQMSAFTLLPSIPMIVFLQIAAASAMFALFFRLQSVGGPVYLSQIGYVGSAVGLVIGILWLGENYVLLTWTGAAILGVGVAVTTLAQMRANRANATAHPRP